MFTGRTQQLVILLAGPTSVGKTDLSEKLSHEIEKKFLIKTSIINADMGQFYGPLNIGTAKPENLDKNKHFLFNIINEPKEIDVYKYRNMVLDNIKQSLGEKKIPIIVGGSGFYLRSLFYPLLRLSTPTGLAGYEEQTPLLSRSVPEQITEALWQDLYNIDPERAQKIPQNDRYRIERALEIWHATNIKPSELKPKFDFPFNFKFIYLTRSRPELYNIINNKVVSMINSGWIGEVENLSPEWINFLKVKKIIGYPEIISYLENNLNNTLENSLLGKKNLEALISIIQQKTRNYAKRQETFFRQLIKDLRNNLDVRAKDFENLNNISKNSNKNLVAEFNLTLSDLDLYIERLVSLIKEDI